MGGPLFRRLIDFSLAELVAVAKHARPMVVAMVVEELGRLKAFDAPKPATAQSG